MIMNNDKISQVEDILNNSKDLESVPHKVKFEKKEKGLYERANTVLITEDNKMMLND